MRREIDVSRLERQKRILYDLLLRLQVEESEGSDRVADPLQELWGLVDLCEDLLDAVDAEDILIPVAASNRGCGKDLPSHTSGRKSS